MIKKAFFINNKIESLNYIIRIFIVDNFVCIKFQGSYNVLNYPSVCSLPSARLSRYFFETIVVIASVVPSKLLIQSFFAGFQCFSSFRIPISTLKLSLFQIFALIYWLSMHKNVKQSKMLMFK